MAEGTEHINYPSEPTVVSGVVHPHGASGVKIGKTQDWMLQFAFETWRDAEGALHTNKLAIRRKVTKDELEMYMSRIQAFEVLSTQIIFTGPTSADLLDIPYQVVDPSDILVQRASELLIPKTHEHEFFGTLTFNPHVDWYEATAMWVGQKIRLSLSASDDVSLQAALQTATELWNDQSTWNQRIQEYAVQELLDLKNSAWLEEGENSLSSDDFTSRMSLESITVSPDGKFDFWHDDGDLFWGHSILVSGTLNDGPTDADIPG